MGSGEEVFKLTKTLIISIAWLFSAIAWGECPPPGGVYNSPGFLQKVGWLEGAPPTCKETFEANWKKNHPLDAKDEKERARNVSCTAAVKQMVAYAQKNVRRLYCDSGSGNAFFQSKTAFGTVNHVFTTGKENSGFFTKQNPAMLESCYIEQKKFDPRTNLNMAFQIPINYSDDQLKLGDRSGDNNAAGDFAVTTVRMPIDDVDTNPVPVMSMKDIEAKIAANGAVDFFMTSANAPAKETPNDCFAVTQCVGLRNYAAEDKASSLYINNCPVIKGFSGSPIFALIKDRDGMCTGFALVGMQRGGTPLKEKRGNNWVELNGRKFHFDEKNPNDEFNVGNNYGIAVAIDNVFRSWLSEASGIKLTEQIAPTTPLKPAGDPL